MNPQFQALHDALEHAAGAPTPSSPVPSMRAQLVALGLLSPAAEAPADRPQLTPDGRDVLDALRSPQQWAEVEQAAARQGIELSMETLKAAVAAAISGGFNA